MCVCVCVCVCVYLLAVGGRGLAKHLVVGQDAVVPRVRLLLAGALTLARSVGGGAKVHEARLLGLLVQMSRGRRQGCQQGQGKELSTHGAWLPSDEDDTRVDGKKRRRRRS